MSIELESLDDYKARQPRPTIPTRFMPTGVACPKCGKEMVQDIIVTLACYPPKKLFLCESCKNIEYV